MTRLALLAVLLVGTTFGRADADCPTNGASGYGPGGYYDYQHSGPTWNEGIYGGHVAYDLIVGTFGASGGGGGGEQSGGVGLGVSDVYQIIGPASATPISFQVVVHLAGTLSASLGNYPYIGTVCDNASTHFQVSSGPTSAVVSMVHNPTAKAYEGVRVRVKLQLTRATPWFRPIAIKPLYVDVMPPAGVHAFDLPPGHSVTSCQGYDSPPVPAATTSWGSLKASYR
jgi:hypothetical protein